MPEIPFLHGPQVEAITAAAARLKPMTSGLDYEQADTYLPTEWDPALRPALVVASVWHRLPDTGQEALWGHLDATQRAGIAHATAWADRIRDAHTAAQTDDDPDTDADAAADAAADAIEAADDDTDEDHL